jgi:hypothetical protein
MVAFAQSIVVEKSWVVISLNSAKIPKRNSPTGRGVSDRGEDDIELRQAA